MNTTIRKAHQDAINHTPIIGFGVVTYPDTELMGLFPNVPAARRFKCSHSYIVALTVADADYYHPYATTRRLKSQLMLASQTGHLTEAVKVVTGWVHIIDRNTRATIHSFVGTNALLDALVCRRSLTNTEIILP